MWRNLGEGRGARCDMNVYKQEGAKKTNNGAKKNETEQAQISANNCFCRIKNNLTKRAKNNKKKLNNNAKQNA